MVSDNIRSKNECKNIEQMLPLYLEGKLGLDDAARVVKHLKTCRECNEELEISYLLNEGVKRVESGETLDVKVELEKKRAHSERILNLIKRTRLLVEVVDITAFFVLVISLVVFFLEG